MGIPGHNFDRDKQYFHNCALVPVNEYHFTHIESTKGVIEAAFRIAQFEPFHSLHELFEDASNFQAREVCADAEMRTSSECEMFAGKLAGDVKLLRAFPSTFVAIGRAIHIAGSELRFWLLRECLLFIRGLLRGMR